MKKAAGSDDVGSGSGKADLDESIRVDLLDQVSVHVEYKNRTRKVFDDERGTVRLDPCIANHWNLF